MKQINSDQSKPQSLILQDRRDRYSFSNLIFTFCCWKQNFKHLEVMKLRKNEEAFCPRQGGKSEAVEVFTIVVEQRTCNVQDVS